MRRIIGSVLVLAGLVPPAGFLWVWSRPAFADLVIAATAKFHRLTILTANTRHFAPLGLVSFNPFERLPG